jgi:monoterpene epsilon-lactone hydrolase
MPSKEFKSILQLLESIPDRSGLSFPERRVEFERETSQMPVAQDVTFESLQVNGIPAEWAIPRGAVEDRAILYLHGGGYTIGSIKTHRGLVSYLSKAAGMRALLIEYRLAPEHPFPAAVEDSVSAYRWLLKEGFDPAKIVIAGDSAGGGLTVATMVKLRDEGEPLPAAAVCLSPWVDMEGVGKSMTTRAEADPIVERGSLLEMAEAYLSGTDPRTPLAAPLYADLDGLPPMLIQVGTAEILLDDSTRLADRAKKAGVDVTLEPWEDMIHIWQFFASMLPEGRDAVDRIAGFLGTHIR